MYFGPVCRLTDPTFSMGTDFPCVEPLTQNGQGKGRHAAKGSDLRIRVPPGAVVRDEEGNFCGELTEDGNELLVARGGRGGRGNKAFKTSQNTAPKFAEKGEVRTDKWLLLELKVLIGLTGWPYDSFPLVYRPNELFSKSSFYLGTQLS